jgi:hypothetical protein
MDLITILCIIIVAILVTTIGVSVYTNPMLPQEMGFGVGMPGAYTQGFTPDDGFPPFNGSPAYGFSMLYNESPADNVSQVNITI